MRWREISRAIVALVNEELNDTRVRVRHMIARGVVAAINDATGFQELTVEIQEGDDPVEGEHFHPGGLYHNAGQGAECVVLRIGGNPAHAVMLGTAERALRPKGKPRGTSGLYTTAATLPATPGMKVFCDLLGVVHLGSDNAGHFVPTATKVDALFARLDSVLRGWTPVANDGGAALKTAFMSEFPAAPLTTAGTKAKTD